MAFGRVSGQTKEVFILKKKKDLSIYCDEIKWL